MTDELLVLNGLDQSLPVDDNLMLQRVDEIMDESLREKDPYIALNFGKSLIIVSQLSGIGLAKLFYQMKENWDAYERKDDFDEIAYDYVGRTKGTVDRYVRVWKMYEQNLIPKNLSEEIRQKNIKEQIPIANLLAQGYEPDGEEWQELADAPDHASISAKIREITGAEPRKSAILIFMSENGELSAQQEGETQFVGYLDINDAGDIAEKAIQRLLKSAGVLLR
jgi:hypothetical protein